MMEEDRELNLAVGPLQFAGFFPSWDGDGERPHIALIWKRYTEVRNVLWLRVINIRLGWPPVQIGAYFTTVE